MNTQLSNSPPKVLNKKYSISFSNVPEVLLNKSTASKHFQKFGTIARLILRPKRKACTVFYTSLRDVEHARKAANLYNGIKFDVDLKLTEKKRSRKSEEDLDPTWPLDPEVKAELDAMSNVSQEVFLRPKKMETERKKDLELRSKSKIVDSKSPVVKKNISQIDSAQVAELIGIVNQMASTPEQRYRILEARDKLIRLHTIKQADVTATQIVGSCPDMCPEKERLMREFQHQVAIYEQTVNSQGDSVMDHSIAIKQYSRSSADQETPLPHELRPVPVLQLTMGYILHKIVDLLEKSDANVSEWYHFVWDRTRGIRKDITQQQLCCLGSVELIEQCSRFHIHCAARLAGEDVSVFDQKINTENLTKCLQTLKYMYHDLELKNIHCPNEAEFRGYIILLNLHDGNFMWEVKQLRLEIQKSSDVSFAIKVYSALDNNNYVSFFKLVQSATYLNACILLRYFNLIRFRAINRIIRTHSSRSIVGQLPVNKLQKILAFEDTISTVNFLMYHGLALNEFQTHVILNRDDFQSPTLSYGVDRAVNVIESKRTVSVGEVICGKALPPKHFEYHIPHCSFDNKGYLKKSEIDQKWVTEIKEKVTKVVEMEPFSQPKPLFHEPKSKPIDTIDSRSSNPFQVISKDESNIQRNLFGTLPSKDNKESSIFGFKPETKLQQISNTPFATFKPEQNAFKTSGFPSLKPDQSIDIFQKKPEQSLDLFQKPANTNFTFAPSNTTSFIFKPQTSSATSTAGFKFALPQTTQPSFQLKHKQIPEKKIDLNEEKFKLEAKRIELEKLKTLEEARLRVLQEKRAMEEKRILEEKRMLEEKRVLEEKRALEKKRALEEQQRLLEEKRQREIEEKERQRKLEEKRINEEIARRKAEALRAEAEHRAKVLEQKRLAILEQEKRERNVKALLADLLDSVELIERNRKLKEISIKIQNWKMKCFCQKWKTKVEISNKKKKMIDNVPVWMSRRSFHEEAQELYTPNQTEALNNMKRYKTRFLKEKVPSQEIERTKVDILDNIFQTYKRTNEILEGNIVNTLNWKVVFSLPDEKECGFNASKLNNMLLSAFRLTEDSEYLVLNQFHPNASDTFNVCFQKFKGFETIKNERCGLFFIGMNDDMFLKALTNRLRTNLNSISKPKAIPVVFLLRNGFTSLTKETALVRLLSLFQELNCYKEENKITDYKVLTDEIGSYKNYLNLLEQGLCWLAENVQPKPPLEMNLLTEFYREFLGTEFIYRIHVTAKRNASFKLLLSNANAVIKIYNKGLSFLMQLINDTRNCNYSDFPQELKQFNVKSTYPCDFTHFPPNWRKYIIQEKFYSNIIAALNLPNFPDNWPPKDENELKESLFNYCASYEKENTNQIFLNVLSFVLDNIRDFNDLQFFPWVHIIQILLNNKINKLHQNQIIVYNKPSYKKLRSEPWWLDVVTDLIRDLDHDLERKTKIPQRKRRKTLNSNLDFDLDEKIKELAEANAAEESKRRKTQGKINQLKVLLDDLENSVHIQKINTSKFEEIIKHEINFNK